MGGFEFFVFLGVGLEEVWFVVLLVGAVCLHQSCLLLLLLWILSSPLLLILVLFYIPCLHCLQPSNESIRVFMMINKFRHTRTCFCSLLTFPEEIYMITSSMGPQN